MSKNCFTTTFKQGLLCQNINWSAKSSHSCLRDYALALYHSYVLWDVLKFQPHLSFLMSFTFLDYVSIMTPSQHSY